MTRRAMKRLLFAAGALLLLLLAGGALALHLLVPDPRLSEEERQQVLAVFGGEYLPPPPRHFGLRRVSSYVPMRDGVRLAVDVLLPGDMGRETRLPTVFIPTRYWRSWDLRLGLGGVLGADRFQRMLVAHGYAVVLVDARGSGASFGSRSYPWSPDERRDYVELMDWALTQPWCDGNLAASGISYSGTAAEFMAIAGHPALKAVLPQFSLYDTYADIAFPGGVFNRWFVANWSRFNRQLDSGQVPEGIGLIGSLLVRGPSPVPLGADGDPSLPWGYEALERAAAEHAANVDIHQAALQAEFRDDVSTLAGVSVDAFSPHTFADQAKASPAAWYSWGGWHDGAYAGSCIKRFRTVTAGHRAVIGPWNHGGVLDTSPFHETDAGPEPPLPVQYMEQIRFLDHHLKGLGPKPAEEIRYYTLGEGRWKTSQVWPPQGFAPLKLHLREDGLLSREATMQDGSEELQTNPALGSGEKNRWRTQILRSDVVMPPRPLLDRGVLAWTSPPLERDMECTGEPVVEVYLQANAEDATLFAYLEDVAPDGTVRYVSEAPFSCINRRLSTQPPPCVSDEPCHSFRREDAMPLPPLTEARAVRVRFGLLPVSWLFRKGHSVRLVLTLEDADQFGRREGNTADTVRLLRGPQLRSRLELPVR